jgi:hypothetical protein
VGLSDRTLEKVTLEASYCALCLIIITLINKDCDEQNILIVRPEGKGPLEDLGIDRIILIWSLGIKGVGGQTGFI